VKEIEIKDGHIMNYGKNFDIVFSEMTRENWVGKQEKFKNYQAIFEE